MPRHRRRQPSPEPGKQEATPPVPDKEPENDNALPPLYLDTLDDLPGAERDLYRPHGSRYKLAADYPLALLRLERDHNATLLARFDRLAELARIARAKDKAIIDHLEKRVSELEFQLAREKAGRVRTPGPFSRMLHGMH